MKRCVFFLLVFVSITSFAKTDISDKYVMRPRTNDLLYFILPNEIESLDKNKNIEFDITYITSEQDITFNFNVFAKQILKIDSVAFISKENIVIKDFKVFYVEKNDNWWSHRISCKFPFEYLKQIYLSLSPYKIIVYEKQNVFSYSFHLKKWKNEQAWMNELLFMIEQNIFK